ATIAGPETSALARALAAAATRSGLDVRSAEVADAPALYPALRSVLEQPAVLVITPDGQVFNSQTVHHVLLTAFRLHAPVLGFSAAYVLAGAAVGLFTTPAQVGTEAAAVVRHVLAGNALPPPGHLALFEVGVNPTVARALGLALPPADALTRALRSPARCAHRRRSRHDRTLGDSRARHLRRLRADAGGGCADDGDPHRPALVRPRPGPARARPGPCSPARCRQRVRDLCRRPRNARPARRRPHARGRRRRHRHPRRRRPGARA